MLNTAVVLPDPLRGMGRGGTPGKSNSLATPQGLDQRSRMEEVVAKMAHRRGSDAGQSRSRWVRSCRWCPQTLQEEFCRLNVFNSFMRIKKHFHKLYIVRSGFSQWRSEDILRLGGNIFAIKTTEWVVKWEFDAKEPKRIIC